MSNQEYQDGYQKGYADAGKDVKQFQKDFNDLIKFVDDTMQEVCNLRDRLKALEEVAHYHEEENEWYPAKIIQLYETCEHEWIANVRDYTEYCQKCQTIRKPE